MSTFKFDQRGTCPHCLTGVRFEIEKQQSNRGIRFLADNEVVDVTPSVCPACARVIVTLKHGRIKAGMFQEEGSLLAWPRALARKPIPPEVPGHIAGDYREAVEVLPISAKASAALSRRCLQAILREAGEAKAKDLADQISEVKGTLPRHIADDLDAVRQVGNFAAHPQKSTSTGTILDVEPHEAEWSLEVLEALFDVYYVQPAQARHRREQFNNKLTAANKPPLKT